jgi:predicted nucleotidyltransferase component of viral defense system
MIIQQYIIAWSQYAPRNSYDLIEHDLVLSKALSELYATPTITENLIFRGETALHKLFFEQAGRFSEDLDFVQIKTEPIGETIDALRACLDSWLGTPKWKQNDGRFTLYYQFETEIELIISRKLKIEINTHEHFNVLPLKEVDFVVDSP